MDWKGKEGGSCRWMGTLRLLSRPVRWSVKAIPRLWGGSNRLHECDPHPPGQNMLVRFSLSRFGTGENMRAPPQKQRPNVLQQTERQWRIKKEVTYVVGLIPGVTGRVHLCYMLDRYHSAEILSKDVSRSASRPGGEQGEIWLVYKAPLTEIQYWKNKTKKNSVRIPLILSKWHVRNVFLTHLTWVT